MLDMIEFGKRVKAVREQILGLNQKELAKKINTTQALLSRIENGAGGSIHVLFDLVNYLNSKNIPAKEIFSKKFTIDSFTINSENQDVAINQIKGLIKELQKSMNKDFDKLNFLMSFK